jgi:hypothetical protein
MLNQAAILKRVFTVLIALWLWQWGHCMTEISSLPSFYMPRIKRPVPIINIANDVVDDYLYIVVCRLVDHRIDTLINVSLELLNYQVLDILATINQFEINDRINPLVNVILICCTTCLLISSLWLATFRLTMESRRRSMSACIC